LALASALQKLELASQTHPLKVAEGASHLFIVNPLSGKSMSKMFSTHPPMAERIRRLQDIKPNF
jgi:heat shock protein HtpX